MALEGASTLSFMDVFDLRDGRRACTMTCLPVKTLQDEGFMGTSLQSSTVEAVEALQMFDNHSRYHKFVGAYTSHL